jgi:hypothetical protein
MGQYQCVPGAAAVSDDVIEGFEDAVDSPSLLKNELRGNRAMYDHG